MEERSPNRAEDRARGGFSRGRLIAGVVIVSLVAAATAFAIGRSRGPVDAGRIAYITEDGVVARDLVQGTSRVIARWPAGASEPRLSADGSRLAYRDGGGSVVVVDVDSGQAARLAPTGRPAAWSPDAQTLAIVRPTAQRRTTLVALLGGALTEIVPGGLGGPDGDPVWIDQERFAVRLLDREGDRGALYVIRLAEGIPSTLHRVAEAKPLTASRDGAELLYVSDRGELAVLTLDGFETRRVGLSGSFEAAATSSAGVVAVAGSTEEGPGVWVLSGGGERPVKVTDVLATAVSWSADGSHILYVWGFRLLAVPVPQGDPRPLGGVRVQVPRFLVSLQ